MKNFLLLLILILSSCSSSKRYDEKVNHLVIVEAELIGKNKILDTLSFEIVKTEKTINYTYKSIAKKSYYKSEILIKKQLKNDSILIFDGEKCRLIDTVVFKFDNKEVVVYKYLYDLINSIDEEEEYYFTKEYGLIYQKGLGWSYHYLFNRKYLAEIQDSVMIYNKNFKPSFPNTLLKTTD